MKSPRSDRRAVARELIMRGLQTGAFTPGAPIPSVRALAAKADVSLVTMWKAVHELAKEGLLVGGHGRRFRAHDRIQRTGVWVGDEVHAGEDAKARHGARARLQARISKDIMQGRLAPGAPFPGMKDLVRDYGCSPPLLRKVLATLCEEGLLESRGRKFVVPQFCSSGNRATIVVLATAEYLELYVSGLGEGHQYLDELELCASRSRVKLQLEPVREVDGRSVPERSTAISGSRPDSTIIGFIYIPSGTPGDAELLREICSTRRPLAVIMHNAWSLPSWMKRYPACLIPVGITDAPGKAVGRFLLGLGHRQVAFLSPYHSFLWSINRYRGLCEAFTEAGYNAAVTALSSEMDQWAGHAPEIVRDSTMANSFPGWDRIPESSSLRLELLRLESRSQNRISTLFALRHELYRTLENALPGTHATAWVAANDDAAIVMMDFLREKGRRIPGDVSVVSFDDSALAIAYGLTSYNFNTALIAAAAFRHILQPAPLRKNARVTQIDGIITERDTTARVGS